MSTSHGGTIGLNHNATNIGKLFLAISLVITSLFSASVFSADPTGLDKSPVDSLLMDRPSADRPKLPDFIPEKLPDFKLPAAEKVLIPEAKMGAVQIKLKRIKFIGNTVISDEALQKIAQPFIGKTVSTTELEDLRQQISQYYTQQGYVNSGAVFPNQQFQDGMITLQIVEGKLTEIRVQGTEWLIPSYISQRLYDDSDQVLNVNQLRQNFQQLLLDPLIERMNGSLVPGSQRGTSILEVDVVRARPYQLTLTADNYRPPSIGSQEGRLSGWVRNLTGLGDTVDGSIAYSHGSLGGTGGFSIPLNAYNSRFNFRFNLNNAAIIEQSLKWLQIKSHYVSYEFGLSQPLIETLNRNLNLGVAFDYKKNKTELLGSGFPFSEGASSHGISKDSVLRFSLDFTERMEHQVFSARSIARLGINAFAPSWSKDQSTASGNFVAWLGQAQYATQVFDTGVNLILRGDLQYSDDKLMPLERFALGGRYSVRGYRANELVRDKGYVVSAEVRYPLLKEEGEKTFPGQLSMFPFMDYGAGWNRGERENISYLHSVGLGLEWQPFKYVNTEIIYAHTLISPTQKANYDLQDSGVHWRISLSAF